MTVELTGEPPGGSELPRRLEEDLSNLWRSEVWAQIGPEGQELLREYAGLLYHWSGRLSLVSRGDRDYLATRHLLPALALVPLVRDLPHQTVLDFGSGAGLPGVPLKIMLPQAAFTLVESRRRRATFLREVVRRLRLERVEVVNQRIEEMPTRAADLVVSRAVMPPDEVMARARPHLNVGGSVLTSMSPGATGPCPCEPLAKKRLIVGGRELWWGLISGRRAE